MVFFYPCFNGFMGLLVHKFIGSDKLMDKQTHKTVEAGIEKHHVNRNQSSISWVRRRFWCTQPLRICARSCSPTSPDRPRPAPTDPVRPRPTPSGPVPVSLRAAPPLACHALSINQQLISIMEYALSINDYVLSIIQYVLSINEYVLSIMYMYYL